MTDESILIKVLGSSPKMRIIDFFMDNPITDFTKKEVIEELGMSTKTFYKYFPDLEKAGVVEGSRRIGRAQLYRLNTKNPVVENLSSLEDALSERERQVQLETGKEKQKIAQSISNQ